MTADCVGGVWTYALDLADALAPHGVEVQLATMGRLPDAEQRRQAGLPPGPTIGRDEKGQRHDDREPEQEGSTDDGDRPSEQAREL